MRIIDADELIKYMDEHETDLRDDPFDGAFDQLREVIRQFPNISVKNIVNGENIKEEKREEKQRKITVELPDDVEAMTLTLIGGTLRSLISVHAFSCRGTDHITIESNGKERKLLIQNDGEK